MARIRDYRAEYRRRQALAETRGFDNYYRQRQAIEQGIAPAIAPARVRTKRTIENQERKFGTLIGRPKPKPEDEWWKGIDVRQTRLTMAENYSEYYAHHWSAKLDVKRAQTDDQYLSDYMQTWVLSPATTANRHTYDRDARRRKWLTDVGYMTDEEYDARYPMGSK